MKGQISEQELFGRTKIGKMLLKIAPPVMLAQLIQALYNIVDSFFVGRYSDDALTAVTVIYPLQLIIIAVAVGTGVGVNTYMAKKYACDQAEKADKAAGTGFVLSLISWAIFAVVSVLIMKPYIKTTANEQGAIDGAYVYGMIVCVGSIGTFLEGNFSKVHQAHGNMIVPMIAQIAGAAINIVFDPLLIFGIGFFPELGVAGAAYATIAGQIVSAIITGVKGFRKPPKPKEMWHYVKQIYKLGYSNIVMQALYTVYIVLLNLILSGFSDAAVTVLGLYYKMQSFFFIPLFGLHTCIVPALSFNYAQENFVRCRKTIKDTVIISAAFMVVGMACFIVIPETLARLFSTSPEVISIGKKAFPIIGSSFISAVFSLTMPVFFQSIGKGFTSLMLSLTRQIFLLVPVFWAFSFIGLDYTWISFPVSETLAGLVGIILYAVQVKKWKKIQTEKTCVSVETQATNS